MASLQKAKRWSTRLIVASFFFVGGIEYSVILPTMWDYLRSKGGEEWLYGITLAAFSISNLITGPLYGLVFDKTHRTKLIVLFANLFEIGGNFMYFAANSKFMIMGSRFIVGLGAGAGAALFAELARTSPKKERTVIFSIFMSMRQVGLIVGPAFNLFLRKTNFNLGPFRVMTYTSPGALMVIIWIIIEVLFIFLFYELPPAKEEMTSEDKAHAALQGVKNESDNMPSRPSPNIQEAGLPDDDKSLKNHSKNDVSVSSSLLYSKNGPDENSPLIPRFSTTTQYNTNTNNQHDDVTIEGRGRSRSCWQSVKGAGRHLMWSISELLREEMVVLLAVLFVTIFSQTTTEAMLVPMTEHLLEWSELENSIFFCVAGAEIILTFIIVSVLSKLIGDRWQIVFGLIVNMVGYAWLLGFTANASPSTPGILWKFIVGSIIMIFGLPLYGVTGASLYSKLLPPSIQGFGQGIRRSVFSTAAILGPLWAGGAVSFSYYILLSVPCGLLLFVFMLMFLSFTKLNEPKSNMSKSTEPTKS